MLQARQLPREFLNISFMLNFISPAQVCDARNDA